MANTTNFNWETPDDTDLVKDGAAAMRTLGNSIDTSFVDLKGGTTGQILSKASNTDLDYTWASPTGPAFSAYRGTSNQTISAATATKVAFNAELFDTANCFDSTTNYRFTPNKSGYYQINACALVYGDNNTEINLMIRKNGTNYAQVGQQAMGGQTYAGMNGSTIIDFNGTTDYVELFVYVGAGAGGPFVYQGSAATYFSGSFIRSL